MEVSLEAGNNADALLIRFHILMRLGRFAQALETAMLSKVLASAHPDAHHEPQTGLLVATLNQALALMHLQRLDEARGIVDHLLQEFSGPSARHGKALDILSDIVYSQGDLRASLELGSRAANMLREFGDDKNLAITLSNLGGCCAHFGLWEQGRSVLEEAIDLFTQHGQFQRVMFARNNLGFLLVESGRYREARSLILSVCGQAHTTKESSVEGAAFSSLTDLEWHSGQLELAWKYHQQSRALDQRESESLVDQAHLEALCGNISRALELIHTPQTPFHLKKTPKRARIALLAGQFEQAIQFLDEAESPEDHETHRAQGRLLRGLAQHKLGRFKAANQDLLEAEHLAQAGGHTPIALEAKLTLALIEGRLDAARDVLKALEELDARGHTLTVQALLPAQWSQLNTEVKPARELAERTMLRTLVSFSLERDGKTSPWRASKTRELLAHLLVAHLREDGPSVPKVQLIVAIWPDSSNDETAEGTFRVTLKR